MATRRVPAPASRTVTAAEALEAPRIQIRHLPYAERLESRPLAAIDLIVIHCTELPDLATARTFGEEIRYAESGTGNSGHFYVDRDGRVEEWVPPERVAHHVRSHNERSVGIELVNLGRYPDWFDSRRQLMTQPYTPEQLDSLARLLQRLQAALPSLAWIAGHETLDRSQVPATDDPSRQVLRKRDPGPLFPWGALMSRIALAPFQQSCSV